MANTNIEGDLTSVTLLAHEIGHAWLAQYSPILNKGFEKADANDVFDTNEHNWILKHVENPFAKVRNEGIRTEYRQLFESYSDFKNKATNGYGDYLFFKSK